MKVIIVGYKVVDYVNDQGRRIQGIRIYYTVSDKYVIGLRVGEKYISDSSVLPDIGEEYMLFFDEKGRLISFAQV